MIYRRFIFAIQLIPQSKMKKNYFLLFLNLLCLGIVHAQNEFITTWETTTTNESITIPTTGSGYNYTVDWGDGTIETGFIGDASHPYVDTGIHTVTITGDFPRIYFANSGDKDKILTVEQWGTIAWTNFLDAFSGCTNLDVTASDAPDLSNVIYLVRVFNGCTSLGTSESLDFSKWDTSGIVALGGAFQNAIAFNSETIKNWDLGKCNGFVQMFSGATSFNQDISNWNIGENSNGTRNMSLMFNNATNFNQSLGNWDISKVTNMSNMLNNSGLSQQNYDATLLGWATDASGDLSDGIDDIPTGIDLGASGLKYCLGESARTTLTDPTGLNWNITDDGAACDVTEAFITTWRINTNNEEIALPIPDTGLDFTVDWGDGIITNETEEAYHTYINAGTYTIRVLGSFNRMRFNGNADRRKIRTIEQWGSNKWTSMESAFKGCSSLVINATDAPDLSNATSMVSMFENGDCIDNGGNLANWNTSTILLMDSMFRNAEMNENINTWDVSNVKSINNMFQACENFNYPLDQWNTGNLESAAAVFVDAKAFNQSLGDWNLSSILDLTDIFGGVNSLSDENYDKTLIGWATLESGESLSSNVTLGAGDAQYCFAEDARSTLTLAPNNWIITDGGAKCTSTDFFITTWETTTANESITIPTSGGGFNYTVDWGDGTIETGFTGDAIHSYADADTHTVKITGDFPQFRSIKDLDNARKLRTIEQWGTIKWRTMGQAFARCPNLNVTATDAPDLSNVTSMSEMFRACMNLQSPDFSNWDTSNVTIMSLMFASSENFNGNITTWDVGKVTDFNSMLGGVTNFNQNLSGWNIGEHVVGTINMNSMLTSAHNFDQNLGAWNLEKVTDISGILSNTGLSTANYDATLIGWAENSNTPSGLHLGASNLTYCLGEAARNILADNSGLNWRITDGGLGCADTDFFITTWETNVNNQSITIPTTGNGYDYSVDWGDGIIETGITGNASHMYSSAGVYKVKITGDFPRIYINGNSAARDKIISVDQWGTQQWTSMESAFRRCSLLVINATDTPDLSLVKSMKKMFEMTSSLVDHGGNIGNWDVSTIENMEEVFDSSNFNENISTWNVSAVKDFSSMFFRNTSFNQNLDSWNTSAGEVFSNMFRDATAFNGAIGSWNTEKARSLSNMFNGATAFNQNISAWDVKNVGNINNAFDGATAFDQDLGSWDISSLVENTNSIQHMFSNSGMSTTNYDNTLIGWARLDAGETKIPVGVSFDAENVNYCLGEAARTILTNAPYNWIITDGGKVCPEDAFITSWLLEDNDRITIRTTSGYNYNYTIDWGDGTKDTNVTTGISHDYTTAGTYEVSITGEFPRFTLFFRLGRTLRTKIQTIEQWGNIQWRSFRDSFNDCENLKLNADDTPDLSQVTELSRMFENCTNFEDLKDRMGSWDVSTIESIDSMFSGCSIFNEDIGAWTFTNLLTTEAAFQEAVTFNQNISSWNMATVIDIEDLFSGASSFDQDLSSWDISSVTSMTGLFTGTALSQENYDNTLIGWATLDDDETKIPTNLTLNADATYCLGESARNTLTSPTYNWEINDGGRNCPGDAFITTWLVANGDEVIIPIFGSYTYNYTIDWGDGTVEYGLTAQASHIYTTGDTYEVKITGEFPALFFFESGSSSKLQTIEQWGTQQWRRLINSFSNCVNLKLNADDVPDLSLIDSTSSMFQGCTNFEDLKDQIGNWDMSNISIISSMFNECTIFNENISDWTFTKLTRAVYTFRNATSFNQDISNWDMSKVDDMEGMFLRAKAFNQPIGNWTLNEVGYMTSFLEEASSFNQDLSNWNMSDVYDIRYMFYGASSFNQDLSSWDISNVEGFDDFFTGSGMTQENYDKTLIGWATLEAGETAIPADMTLNADASYCLAEAARNTLTSSTYNWTINDGGHNCPTPVITLLGDNPQIIEQGDIYVELGATVTYGATLVIDASTVHTNQLGTYTVTYTATTPSGGVATPVIRTVNIEEPCPLLSLSANNFTITTASETCIDTNNGMITVNAATALDYTTTINGVNYDFTSTLTVDNLAPGTYSVCIGVNGFTNCEQCFEAVIEPAISLEGKTELITQTGNPNVNIAIARGTAPYTVMINNEEKGIFDIATFDIDVQHGDTVEVLSSIACEGKLTTNVNLINEFVIAPNPAHDHVIISVPNTGLNSLQVSLYNAIGVHISSGVYTLNTSKVTLPMSSLPQGVYFITIDGRNTFKVVKE